MAKIVYYWDNDKGTLVEGLIKEKTELYVYVTPMDFVEKYAEDQACFVDEVELPEDAPAQGCFPEEVFTDPYGYRRFTCFSMLGILSVLRLSSLLSRTSGQSAISNNAQNASRSSTRR